MKHESLKKKTIKGLTIQFIATIGVNLLTLIQLFIFARIFTPIDFGIFASASLAISFVMLFSQIGISQYIIKEKKDPERIMDTAFSMNLLAGFVFFAIIFFLAPLGADLLNNPDLTVYIRFMSYSAFSAALGLPGIMWVKDMKFGMAKLPVYFSVISNIVVTYVSFVYFCFGTWSLFLGSFAAFLGNTIVIWILAPYKPKPRFDIKKAKNLYIFGWPLFFSSILGYIVWYGDDLAVRYFCGDEALGYYTFGFYIPVFLLKLAGKINAVLFPVFSKIQDSEDKLEYTFNILNKYTALIFAPLGMSLFAFAPQIVHYVFTDKWGPAINVLQLSAFAFTIRVTTGCSWDKIALVKGKTKYIMFIDFINALSMCTIGIYLIHSYETLGGAFFNVLIQTIVIPIMVFWFIKKELGNLNFLRKIWIPISISIILALIVIFFIEIYLSNLYIFILAIIFYFSSYFFIIYIIDKNLIEEIKEIIKLAF